jgi:hypothetical protein
MTERMRELETQPVCPTCGEQLRREADLLRCTQHGLFFSYGPKLLVAVASPTVAQPPLMPWQTLEGKR